jgi:hypothetical protein
MEQSNEYAQSYQTTTGGTDHHHHHHEDPTVTNIESWDQLLGETRGTDNPYQDVSQADTSTDQTSSFGFQRQENIYQYNQDSSTEEINPDIDYETIIRSKHLYYDPEPQIIRKPSVANPLIYNQNIQVRFLQPPPVPQGTLIIREVRPPQPPPPPPLVSFIFRLSNNKNSISN